MASQVVRPRIPYRGSIPGGLHDGKLIEVRGTVPYGADVFDINLLTGLDQYSDKPLHLSVRFSGRSVIRNSMERGSWGAEERHGTFPFHSGRDFTIMILADPDCYRIAVDSQHCWEFSHRISMSRVNSILIDGNVKIEKIEFIDKSNPVVPPPEQIRPAYITPGGGGSNLTPVYNPSIPYAYPIYGGLKPGMMVYISGRPSASAYKFGLNFQSGTAPYPPPDIALHFDVRFFNRTIVRNSRTNNVWGQEDTQITHFPFQQAVNFDMIIRVESDRYMIALNGQHLVEFRHRLAPPSRFDTLYIENDIVVSSIRVS